MTDNQAETDRPCRSSDACAECGVRRDEHADQPLHAHFPTLNITGHAFAEAPEGYPEHYADYGCGERPTRPAPTGSPS